MTKAFIVVSFEYKTLIDDIFVIDKIKYLSPWWIGDYLFKVLVNI